MITVIVPLDFSETSFNAAHYAADMYKERPGAKIILYHARLAVQERLAA